MSTLGFTNGRVIIPGGIVPEVRIVLHGDRIASIKPGGTIGGNSIDLEGGWLMPGFIDAQVNGGGGVLFNDEINVDAIAAIGIAHSRYGTTGFLPTLISDELDAVARALDVADEAIEAGVAGVLGVHLEGPFLNVRRKGIHEEAHFRRLDAAAIDLLARPRKGIVMVTLAPELCAPGDIATLVGAGVRVSAGHSDASYDEMMAAMDAGLDGVTHLFNAMSPLHHRELGVVGAALDGGRAWCGLIADGAHVHHAALRIAMRGLPANRLMLVTDAMPSVGAAHKDFVLQGKQIKVWNGMCLDAEGQLAGSDLDMAQAVRNMVEMAGATPEAAAAMASTNPAAFLRLSGERGALAPGLRADWVWLDEHFAPRATWIGGKRTSLN
ncbi:N-acetylglucosamine-6-phosphate deacetylase [Sphingomonas koreensis]|nr:N-acetylglucosamine-6-phosphate deacetylase [Sphingomonas koreensis]